MMNSEVDRRSLSFESYRLDCVSGELRKSGREVRLQPQPAKLLVLLATRKGEVVTRGEIQKALWGEDTFVDFEHGINFCIKQIRDALGDDAEKPRYIETVPRVGYRFLAEARGSDERERSPYPGLSSFTSADSGFFFGREEEAESVLRKLESRRMLALIGASGAGKSSFLRAGLLPSLPGGWRAVISTPGSSPVRSLSRALVPELSGDAEAMRDLVEDVVAAAGRWRGKCERALLVVDAFEELFTLNPPEIQKEFASVLLRLVEEADVHVLLSMRDDFLIRCHDFEELSAVFQDLTPLGPLKGTALRRALVEPARSCGYRFEREELVTEMLSAVEGERGALPLLAFAALRLWEKRDREKRLLKSAAYQEIGGVAGALARHAEETLERIGEARTPLVRELFRNLVTALGTRASREVEELLSIFPKVEDRKEAEGVLQELVAARLLTSYEKTVEVIHESLLSAWPRLVQWRNQDKGGALLRDQLRQAAHLWEERRRAEDLLWTGTSYRELSLWRERYSGGLSSVEEEFVQSTARRASRQRRRKTYAVSALVAGLTMGLVVVGGLWRRSETETRRAEASKLLALGQLQVERNPSGALAYAIKSLDLADTEEARTFTLRVLQEGSVGRRIPEPHDAYIGEGLQAVNLAFSSNSEWLAIGGYRRVQLRHREGGKPVVLPGEYESSGQRTVQVGFTPDGGTLITNRWGDIRLWSIPDGRVIREIQAERGASTLFVRSSGLFTSTIVGEKNVVRFWPFGGSESILLGSTDVLNRDWAGGRAGVVDIDAEGKSMAYGVGKRVYRRSLTELETEPELVAQPSAEVLSVAYHPDGKHLAVSDGSGEVRVWSTFDSADRAPRVLTRTHRTAGLRYSSRGRWLLGRGQRDNLWVIWLWDMSAPPASAPLELRTDSFFLNEVGFEPEEKWLVALHGSHANFWPLGQDHPAVLEGHEAGFIDIAFTPDGSSLLSSSRDGTLRIWPIEPGSRTEPRVLLSTPMTYPEIANDPSGTRVVVSARGGRVLVVPIEGGTARELKGFSTEANARAVAFSPGGRLVAAAPDVAPVSDKVIRVWDIESGVQKIEVPVPGAAEDSGDVTFGLEFSSNDHLLVGHPKSDPGLALYDLRNGEWKSLANFRAEHFVLSRSGGFGFAGGDQLMRFSLDGAATPVPSHGLVGSVAMDSKARVLASAGKDGAVRIGPVSGKDPYLMFGHKGAISALAFSPEGHWLASAGEDRAIRLWRVPEVTSTPPHRRSHEDFLAMLRSWTNLRVVQDPGSATGYKVEPGPFPGWKTFPTW